MKSETLRSAVSWSFFWLLSLSAAQGCAADCQSSHTFKGPFPVGKILSRTTETFVINSVVGTGDRGPYILLGFLWFLNVVYQVPNV